MFTRPHTSGQTSGISRGDLFVLVVFGFFVYGLVSMTQRWTGEFQPLTQIDLDPWKLPVYSLYSLFRALIAYGLSLTFTLLVGSLAAKNRTASAILIPLLDIGQSIPVLGFLPGLVLGLIALFPKSNFGLELACILMIFTGQVWNMTFSFYSSLRSIPKHFYELSSNIRLRPFQSFIKVELPFSASSLAWNSLMSMAGGWFFLTTCEAFVLGSRTFRLPGIGSYMAVAIEQGDHSSILCGFLAMVLMIASIDFLIWRPVLSWTRKFNLDEATALPAHLPFIQLLWQESKLLGFIGDFLSGSLFEVNSEALTRWLGRPLKKIRILFFPLRWIGMAFNRLTVLGIEVVNSRFSWVLLLLVLLWILSRIGIYLQQLSWLDWGQIVKSCIFTLGRVLATLVISTVWAVPFAIWIGLSPGRTRFFQPLIQIAASFPAPMLYPLALGILQYMGIQLGFGSIFLMTLGVQWYVLFNVLSGVTLISQELRESFLLMAVPRQQTWVKLYLPTVFPSLVTGWITAAGGAWNSSIIAEFVQYKAETLSTQGLGSLISQATATGNYPLLLGALIGMVVVVVGFNRLVWNRLYQWVEARFRFER